MVLAGNTPVSGVICRTIRLPADSPHVIAAINGALSQLKEVEYWDDTLGTFTAQEAADLCEQIYLDYIESTGDCMIGQVVMFATADLPGNVLICDGFTYNRVDYPRLYEKLPPIFRIDANTFQVPDMSERFVMATSGSVVIGDTGGVAEVTLAEDQMPTHTLRHHTVTLRHRMVTLRHRMVTLRHRMVTPQRRTRTPTHHQLSTLTLSLLVCLIRLVSGTLNCHVLLILRQ